MTSGRLKRSRATTVTEVYNNGPNLDDYEDASRGANFDADSLSGPPAKKFVSASDSLPGHVNDLAACAAVLASSSNNQFANEQLLQNGLIGLENQALSSAGFPIYASASATQLALLAQKQQQRSAALAAQCLLPQHAGLLLNQQLRSATYAQPSMLNTYACPISVQSLVPQQNQLSATMLSAANSSLINPASYYEGAPLIMAATSSQSQLMRMSNTASPECKIDTSLYYNVFVGDLSPEVTHDVLQKAFEKFGPLIEAKVMIDQSSGKSRSFGFVTYWKQESAAKAIEEMNGQMVGKRAIRTNWATRQKETRVATYEEILKAGDNSNPSVYLKNVGELTEQDIRENFDKYGTIKQIRLFSSKNYGFVVYASKENAARAILEMSGQKIKGHLINCSWGRVQEPAPKTNTLVSAVSSLNPASLVAQLPFQSVVSQIYQPALLQNWRV